MYANNAPVFRPLIVTGQMEVDEDFSWQEHTHCFNFFETKTLKLFRKP